MCTEPGREYGRGQSEVLGVVLLLGLVLAGALVVAVIGSSTISDVQQQQNDEGAAVIAQEVDSKVQSLAGTGDIEEKTFVVDEALPRDLKLQESTGYLDITVNGRSACSVTVSLDTIQQTNSDGEVVGLQAGGVWAKSPGGGSAMIAGPDVTFENETFDVTVANLTGNIDKGTNQAVRDVTASRNRTRAASDTLFAGPCSNLDNVTMEVNSQFSGAWEEYLRQETGVTASNLTRTNDTTFELFVPERKFPRSVDNDRNQVVNLSSGASYMNSVTADNGTISVDKNASSEYRVFMSALDSWEPNIGGVRNFSGNVSNARRKPVDFVLVMDTSGSMSGSKIQNARAAAQDFVGITEFDKGDRIAVIDYSTYSEYRRLDGDYFSRDASELNTTLGNLTAGGGTDYAEATKYANQLIDLRSNSNTREKHVLFLTDGQNALGGTGKCDDYYDDRVYETSVTNFDIDYTGGSWSCTFDGPGSDPKFGSYDDDTKYLDILSVRFARNANRSNTTMHAIAFGNGADNVTLKEMKNRTDGGTFSYASTGSELKQVFKSIGNNITSARQVIALDPLSTNVSTGAGLTDPPQIPGDTSGLATMTNGSKQFVNVNDPTAPSRFSHALPVSGGVDINLSAYTASCNQWNGTGEYRTNSTTGNQYPVVRCTNMSSPSLIQPDNVTILTDESNVSSMAQNSSSAWWQPNTSDMLNDSRIYNATTGDYELASNQALVVLEFNNTGSSDPARVLPVLFKIGLPEKSVSAADIVNVDISEVTIEN